MSRNRTELFRGRQFGDVTIILCVRWYLRYSLSYRDLEEMMAERGLLVGHVTYGAGSSTMRPFRISGFGVRSGIQTDPDVCPGRR